ncbi:MAG: S1C family serine protease [Sphingosinicella sp.]
MPRRFTLLSLLLAVFALAWPNAARADIAAAGRGVVRVVVVALEDGEVVGFGHGSGFAVAPNRIVTNAHVVNPPEAQGVTLAIGVVPAEGSRAVPGRLVAAEPTRDLALIEIQQRMLTPLTLYTGPLADGAAVAALGYPANVDLATAQSADDYINPLPPTRSTGIFSNIRPIGGITTLLHTANIARGHSGGPLLDACGRVLGVNTLITRNQDGDAPFAFAVANRELTEFLRKAGQPVQAVASECVSMAERLSQEQQRRLAEEQARLAGLQARELRARDTALARIQESRETRLGVAALLVVLSLLAFGGAGLLLAKNQQKPGYIAGGAGGVLLLAAAIVFFTRPGLADAERSDTPAKADAAEADPARFAGRNLCELVSERSRVTVSSTQSVPIEWSESGCVNGRTHYARNGAVWTRVLVPNDEQAVSVLEFRPGSGEYVVSRYLLSAAAMNRARSLRRGVEVKACTNDPEARTVLADQLRDIGELLPQLPNERLVYRCRPAGGGSK